MTLLLLDTIFWNRKLVKSKMEAPLNHTWKPFTEQPQRTVHPQWLSLRAHVHMKKLLLQDVKKGTLVQEQLFPGLHCSALLCVIIFWEPGICLSGRQECCDNVVTKTTYKPKDFHFISMKILLVTSSTQLPLLYFTEMPGKMKWVYFWCSSQGSWNDPTGRHIMNY
jgi:hypothetical protein